MTAREVTWQEAAGVLGLLGLLLLAYSYSFLDLLVTPDGTMGHDYRFFLPALLSGYYWFETNGLAQVPWYSPSQCGGLPFLGDLQIPYYSVPQFLTFLQPPSEAVVTTFLLFAAIGFLSAYGLLRGGFRTGPWMAATGAAIFLFNGFYAYRVLVGHLTYHAYMLTPLLVWALVTLPEQTRGPGARLRFCGRLAAGSLVAGYMLHAGMGNVVLVLVLTVAMMLVIHALVFGWRLRPWLGAAACGTGGLAIAAVKLVPSLSFLARFPRDFYSLPGFANPLDTLGVAVSSLYFLVSPKAMAAKLENQTWWSGQHEWTYGITLVPLVLLAFGIVLALRASRGSGAFRRGRFLALAALLGLALVPLALNTYGEAWTALLKVLPVIGQATTHFRLFAVYILPATVLPVVLIDRSSRVLPPGALARTAVVAVATLVALTVLQDRSPVAAGQTYDARVVDRAYRAARQSGRVPPITHIAAKLDADGAVLGSGPRNDALVDGGSYLKCYQPIFGYRLETFPAQTLAPGPILEIRDGVFNLKDPSCYDFPEENDCAPGDHFAAERRDAAERFSAYRPFEFKKPWYQTAATWVSVVSLAAALATLAAWLAATIWTPRGGAS